MDKETRLLQNNNRNSQQMVKSRTSQEQPMLQIRKEFRKKLTPEQDQIVNAIEANDSQLFEKMGGSTTQDLNFEITSEGIFPLLLACAKGDKQMVTLLLKNPTIEINKTDVYGVNAFWIASFYGHIDIMRQLMSKGIDLMCRNQNGSNALHIAVKQGNTKVIQTLLDIHYPLDYTKNNGVSALGIAAHKGSLPILQLLINAGADINLTSKQGITPLYLAIKSNQMSCVKFLCDRKATVHLVDPVQSEYSPLFIAIRLNNLPAVECICDTQVRLDGVKNNMGYGPLTYAASLRFNEIVNYLSLRLKNLNQEDPDGFTAFTKYLSYGEIQMAQTLLNRGSDINYCNREGKTPLSLMIKSGNEQAVKFLLEKGANPHIEDLSGLDSCDYAKQNAALFSKFKELNNCNKDLRRSSHRKNGEMPSPSPQKQIKQNPTSVKKSKPFNPMIADSIQKLPDKPIDQQIQIIPITKISVPEIDKILEAQNSGERKDINALMSVEKVLQSQRMKEDIELQNHNYKMQQLQQLVKEADLIGKDYNDGILNNPDILFENTKQKPKPKKQTIKVQYPQKTQQNNNQESMRNSFWTLEQKVQDAHFKLKMKEAERKIDQISQSNRQSLNNTTQIVKRIKVSDLNDNKSPKGLKSNRNKTPLKNQNDKLNQTLDQSSLTKGKSKNVTPMKSPKPLNQDISQTIQPQQSPRSNRKQSPIVKKNFKETPSSIIEPELNQQRLRANKSVQPSRAKAELIKHEHEQEMSILKGKQKQLNEKKQALKNLIDINMQPDQQFIDSSEAEINRRKQQKSVKFEDTYRNESHYRSLVDYRNPYLAEIAKHLYEQREKIEYASGPEKKRLPLIAGEFIDRQSQAMRHSSIGQPSVVLKEYLNYQKKNKDQDHNNTITLGRNKQTLLPQIAQQSRSYYGLTDLKSRNDLNYSFGNNNQLASGGAGTTSNQSTNRALKQYYRDIALINTGLQPKGEASTKPINDFEKRELYRMLINPRLRDLERKRLEEEAAARAKALEEARLRALEEE